MSNENETKLLKQLPLTAVGTIDIDTLVTDLASRSAPDIFLRMVREYSERTNLAISWDAIGLRENTVLQDALDWDLKRLEKDASPEDVITFGKFVCKAINTIYGKSERQYRVESVTVHQNGYCLELGYDLKTETSEPKVVESDEELNFKHAIGYQRNKAFFFKDKKLMNWILSFALVGADIMFSDSVKAGY